MRVDPGIPVGGPSGPSFSASSSRMLASTSTPILAAMGMRNIGSSGLKALLQELRA